MPHRPPGAQIDGDLGVKKIIGRFEPPNPPGKSDPGLTLNTSTNSFTKNLVASGMNDRLKQSLSCNLSFIIIKRVLLKCR